ncbi:hypothetical protein [Burkholderia vietnamiensis]|uniref:hypothetical protein n=1 Tax=Burkholderia vietnamiensis TaxID=60552 RepID=UPI00264B0280|nr:hypothetical protein [Burkholderia vietnamiensis]MDN7814637.1 hypothetical protein [Burkholderia vietnamiensis]
MAEFTTHHTPEQLGELVNQLDHAELLGSYIASKASLDVLRELRVRGISAEAVSTLESDIAVGIEALRQRVAREGWALPDIGFARWETH